MGYDVRVRPAGIDHLVGRFDVAGDEVLPFENREEGGSDGYVGAVAEAVAAEDVVPKAGICN